MKRFFSIAFILGLIPSVCFSYSIFEQIPDNVIAEDSITIDSISIDSLWLSMPETVCPAMNMSDVLPQESTENFFSASVTTASLIEMRKLPTINGDVICVVKTYLSPTADSDVEFYDLTWNRVGEQKFSLEDVISGGSFSKSGVSLSCLKKLLQPLLISASLNSKNTDLQLTINPVMLSDDEQNEIKDVCFNRTLKWNGKEFK